MITVAPHKVLKLSSFGLSDIGLVRQKNEDVWAQLPENCFFVIADGMGGHRAGEIAARESVNALCHLIKKQAKSDKKRSLANLRDYLQHAIQLINGHVFKLSKSNEELKGMGTTICCLQFHPNGVILGHVGDSRIYRMRNGKLEQLTRDHSLLRELLDSGLLDTQQANDFLYKNIITKAIGTEATIEPSVYMMDIAAEDVFMMCTDGLSDLLSHEDIENIMNKSANIEDSVTKLIQTAKVRGGHDNITVLMVKVEESDEHKDLSR